MTFNFTATLTPIADSHDGDAITMGAQIAANTAADAGTFLIYFELYDASGAKTHEAACGSVALTTTPQSVSSVFYLPSNLPLGQYHYTVAVLDSGYHWQNTTQTQQNFNVVATPIPVAKLNMVIGNDAGGVSQPITVQALDATGAPIPNAPIAWSTTVGSLSAASTVTDANGKSLVTYTYPSPMKQAVIVASAGSATLVMPF